MRKEKHILNRGSVSESQVLSSYINFIQLQIIKLQFQLIKFQFQSQYYNEWLHVEY